MAENLASTSKFCFLLVLATSLVGCESVKSILRPFLKSRGSSHVSAPASPSPAPERYTSEAAKNAKANAELLREMFLVIFMREPKSRAVFGDYLDSMNQGASLEGIYNGFTHSADYRSLESNHRGASPSALQAFGQELALLELEFPVPAEFDARAAQPLALPVNPGEEPSEAVFDPIVPKPETSNKPKPSPTALAEQYSKLFVGASIYTLKRVLGDEALKVMASKKKFPEELPLWYSKWVVRIAGRNVDFGLPLRNKREESFHYAWAKTASEDRMRWEVLNRIHRVLNETNRLKQ